MQIFLPIDSHFYYNSNGGTFVSNGYELLKLFHNYWSQLALPSGKGDDLSGTSGMSGLSGARFRQKSGAARIFKVVENKSEF